MRNQQAWFGLVILSVGLPQVARAGFDFAKLPRISRISDVTCGALIIQHPSGALFLAPVLRSDVSVHVTGVLARTEVRQTFQNPSEETLEGIYAFPLPDQAAVDHMQLIVGERIVEGRIKESGHAREIYARAKQQGDKASLVEQLRPNLFSTRVANLGPGNKVEVVIRFQETLVPQKHLFTLRFPLAFTQRYAPEGAEVLPPPPNPAPTKLRVLLDPGFPLANLASPSHPIVVEKRGRARLVRLGGLGRRDRDFLLTWTPKPSPKPRATILSEVHGDAVYALMMMLPPTETRRKERTREIIFILDSSASMEGRAMDDAKAAVLEALKRHISPRDHFNIIEFDARVRRLFPESRPGTRENLRTASDFVREIKLRRHDEGGPRNGRPPLGDRRRGRIPRLHPRFGVPRHRDSGDPLSTVGRRADLARPRGATPWPGRAGNVVLAAHKETHFAFLPRLKNGDRLTLESPYRTRTYRVDGLSVVHEDDRRFLTSENDRLTLVTYYPFGTTVPPPPLRYVVVATPIGG